MVLKAILFDWGNTLMVDYPEYSGAMCKWPNVSAMPEAQETLEKLSKNFELYVATNAKDSEETEILEALNRVGLGKYFKRIFCYKSLGVDKLDPHYFQQIVSDLGYIESSILMVGDSLEKDIKPALKAGLNGVLLSKSRPAEEEIECISSLGGLLRITRMRPPVVKG